MAPRSLVWIGTLAIALSIPAYSWPDPKAPVCVAVGIGAWIPEHEGGIWPQSRALTLSRKAEHDFNGLLGRQGWRAIVLEPIGAPVASDSEDDAIPELDRAWFWVAPTADSLIIVRPAMLSEGMEVVGVWISDTLRGRASAFSDAGPVHLPRANAYGLRYR
jgi:hypothetical protein